MGNGEGELRGTRAVVLGSTSGIGRATALSLASAGADVIVHGRSTPEKPMRSPMSAAVVPELARRSSWPTSRTGRRRTGS
jgi:NAD(P)-dependent dehydrogenase (short-subunit alcohol dehydrogenase family)